MWRNWTIIDGVSQTRLDSVMKYTLTRTSTSPACGIRAALLDTCTYVAVFCPAVVSPASVSPRNVTVFSLTSIYLLLTFSYCSCYISHIFHFHSCSYSLLALFPTFSPPLLQLILNLSPAPLNVSVAMDRTAS